MHRKRPKPERVRRVRPVRPRRPTTFAELMNARMDRMFVAHLLTSNPWKLELMCRFGIVLKARRLRRPIRRLRS